MDTESAKAVSLLSRMTNEKAAGDAKFTPAQVQAVVEVLVKKLIESMPGMPVGMRCDIEKLDADTWNLRVTRPKSE